jgi:hypothetical protein
VAITSALHLPPGLLRVEILVTSEGRRLNVAATVYLELRADVMP